MLQEFVELKVQQFGVHAINLGRRTKVGLARGEGEGGGKVIGLCVQRHDVISCQC